MSPLIVCGTGHRPDKLGGYGNHQSERLLTGIATDWLEAYEDDCTVISGMALGWDMALAIAARNLKIPYIAAIPFKGQESRWWPAATKLYDSLLADAVDVVVVCDGGYAPWKMQERNKWMVDHSDLVLAMWNGDTKGGTYNCVAYADKVNKPITNLWEIYESVRATN